MKKTDLNRFNTGGSHASNPMGGIPLGKGQNGKINTVEENETEIDGFIFSDTVTLTKDVIEQFNLPKSLENKTVAQATKFIDNKFKDRNDKISNSTKMKMLDSVAQAQETIKAKQQNLANSFEANSTEVPDMMNGQAPEGFESFLPQNKMFLGGMTTDEGALTAGASAGISGGLGALSSFAMGNNDQGISNLAKTGATIGLDAIVPGLGMAASPIIDITTGLIGNASMKNKQRKQAAIDHIKASGTYQNDFALGGPIDPNFKNNGIINMQQVLGINQDGVFGPKSKQALINWQKNNGLTADGILGPKTYTKAGLTKDGNNFLHPTEEPNIAPRVPNDPLYQSREDLLSTEQTLPTFNVATESESISSFPKANLKPVANWLGNNYGDIMRYAPVAANLLQLNKLERPKGETLNRLGNRYIPQYADERSVQNIVNNELDNVSNSLTSAVNGSEGALRNSLLGVSLNRAKSLSDAYGNIAGQNRQQNTIGQQFNAGIDQTNLNQSNLELDINDRNKAAYDTNKSRLISEIGNNIGDIGKEEVYKKIARNTYGYTWDGRYWVKPDGTKATDEDIKNEITNSNKLGGKLFKSKRR